MPFEELEIAWLAGAIFFGFGQATSAIILSLAPRQLDDVIVYFEWITRLVQWVQALGFVSLFFAIFMTWLYSVSNGSTFSSIILCVAVTAFGVAAFIILRRLMARVIHLKLRPTQLPLPLP